MPKRVPVVGIGDRSGELEVVEILPDYLNPSGRRYQRVRAKCSCGNTIDVHADRIRLGKATQCHHCAHAGQIRYKIGNRYDMLVVEGFRHDPSGRRMALCVCDCGNQHEVFTGLLTRNKTLNCGCRPLPTYTGIGKLSGAFFYRLKSNAEARGLSVEVSPEYLWNLFLRQDKRCALSGLPIALNIRGKTTASVDRIDATNDYVKGNVQWVHKDINKMKGTHDSETFINLCGWVAEHQGKPPAHRPEPPKPRHRKKPGR